LSAVLRPNVENVSSIAQERIIRLVYRDRTEKPTDRQRDRQIDRHTDRQSSQIRNTGRQTDRQTIKQPECIGIAVFFVVQLKDCLTVLKCTVRADIQTGRQTDRTKPQNVRQADK
jgi:hypothetical protein